MTQDSADVIAHVQAETVRLLIDAAAEHVRSERKMHRPSGKPSCWTNGPAFPRCQWSFDQGAACASGATVERWKDTLHHTPGCAGCSRGNRALDIAAGCIEPYEAVKSASVATPKETAP